jgi:protein-tyrosine-phosphatase
VTQSRGGTLHVLFLCTHNAARSQMAEAVMKQKADRLAPGRFVVASAGSDPGAAVHPMAVRTLREHGIDWTNRTPKGIDQIRDQPWDLVITVCDRAKESCPTLPGQPAFAHWGMDDPSDVGGDDEARRTAFRDAFTYLGRRIDLLLALPFESLERSVLEKRVQRIAEEVPVPRRVAVDRP